VKQGGRFEAVTAVAADDGSVVAATPTARLRSKPEGYSSSWVWLKHILDGMDGMSGTGAIPPRFRLGRLAVVADSPLL
jgi:hypothetical protein